MAPAIKNDLTVQLFKEVDKGPQRELAIKIIEVRAKAHSTNFNPHWLSMMLSQVPFSQGLISPFFASFLRPLISLEGQPRSLVSLN